MECVICKNGRTHKGKTTVTLERGGTFVIIKDVPAMICENCGEFYLDKKTTQEILKRAEESVQKGSGIEVINMKKVA